MQIFCNALHKKRGRSKIQCFLVGWGDCCSVLLLPQKKVQVKSQFPVTKIQFHPSKSVPQKKGMQSRSGIRQNSPNTFQFFWGIKCDRKTSIMQILVQTYKKKENVKSFWQIGKQEIWHALVSRNFCEKCNLTYFFSCTCTCL